MIANGINVGDQRLLEAWLRNDIVAFTQRVFNELHPGKRMISGWHHEAIANCLKLATIDRAFDRFIINLPPRSLKSIMVSVALPAFLLGRDPTRKIIVVSYNQDLANDLSRQTRQIMRAPWYRRLFPSTQMMGQGAVGQFFTSSGGFRAALSTGGTFTGKGGDLIIIDDPLKGDDAYSEPARKALIDWTSTTLFSRLDDKSSGAIILVQQRQHEDDLSGHLLRQGGWYHLSLPAIAVKQERICLSHDRQRFHTRQVGDVLDPVREPLPVLKALEQQMGRTAFLAQYQQEPVPPDGSVIKIQWFRHWRELPPADRLVLSIDTAIKGGLNNDYSVAMLWRVVEKRYYLDFVWRNRVEFPALLHAVKEMNEAFQPDIILIEDKGSGSGLIQALRDDPAGIPAVAYDPGSMDKKSRMEVQAFKIEAGRVFIPEEAPWLDEFLEEVRRFPQARHDDQIDAMSQFLDYMGRRPTGDLIILKM